MPTAEENDKSVVDSLPGLTEPTRNVLRTLSEFRELREYNLVGGTGLSVQLDHRLSEDLDLFVYNTYPGNKRELPHLKVILNKIHQKYPGTETIHFDKYQCTMIVSDKKDNSGIKVDLFSEGRFHGPKEYSQIGYIRLPSLKLLLGMKLVTLSMRDQWRDIYDLYVLSFNYDDDEFYHGYAKIMSRYYLGTKNKDAKRRNYNNLVGARLKDGEFIEQLKALDAHFDINLSPAHQVDGPTIAAKFYNYGNISSDQQ